MTAKADLMRQVRLLSSGTVATFIGNDRYTVIDRAVYAVLQFISFMTEEECAKMETLEDIRNLFLTAQKL